MSDPKQAVTAAEPAPAGFTPDEAEAVIRRAVLIHERASENVSVDHLKETLASLGVRPATVERAVKELHAGDADAARLHKPSDLIMGLAGIATVAAPGAALVVYREDVPLLPAWAAAAVGAGWVLLMAYEWVRSIRLWWRKRSLQ